MGQDSVIIKEVDEAYNECFFCGKKVGEECFCYGCGEFVCNSCNRQDCFGEHQVEAHKEIYND